MCASTLPFDRARLAPFEGGGARASSALARSIGGCRLTFDAPEGTTRLKARDQRAPARILTPRDRATGLAGATLVNEAGGLAGGDRLDNTIEVGPDARAVVTTQAAEKVYRSTGPASVIATELSVSDDGWLEWLPQETILFDRAHLRRLTTARVAPEGRLLAGELLVLGRTAHGERVSGAHLLERWRVHRADRLVWADGLRLDPPNASLDAPAGFAGQLATATLIYAAPDAPDHLHTAREVLTAHAHARTTAGVSVVGGLLLIRALAADGAALRRTVADVWSDLRHTLAGLPARVPAAWHT
ncbi:urease accessory protein UreD [Rhodovibrio salinarum]|uniref:Urease accessory protein UreD n=1 Tax=Rhodovibrio salinarum TaxID=1087 RepID=A0A934QKH4_9PROT|nr:urease accessory protein UreD [Rhodovibrio salinarum]MBK1698195.1 urease accessory protein [Rhodovibrio salinarum]